MSMNERSRQCFFFPLWTIYWLGAIKLAFCKQLFNVHTITCNCRKSVVKCRYLLKIHKSILYLFKNQQVFPSCLFYLVVASPTSNLKSLQLGCNRIFKVKSILVVATGQQSLVRRYLSFREMRHATSSLKNNEPVCTQTTDSASNTRVVKVY